MSNFKLGQQGQRLVGTISGDRGAGGCHYPFVEIFSHLAGPVQAGTKSVTLH